MYACVFVCTVKMWCIVWHCGVLITMYVCVDCKNVVYYMALQSTNHSVCLRAV